MEEILPGQHGECEGRVVEALLATHLGSGSVPVYGTPAMLALIAAAGVAAVDPVLPEGQVSVGIALDVRHLAATPVGERVRARAEVVAVEGHKVTFRVQAWDEHAQIGEGTHARHVVDVDRFLARVQAKRGATGSEETV
jgi:predicted thioesterase